jgi:hypothetical protein
MKAIILALLVSVASTGAAMSGITKEKAEKCAGLMGVVLFVAMGRDFGNTPEKAYLAITDLGVSPEAANEIVINVFYKMKDNTPNEVADSFLNYCISEET